MQCFTVGRTLLLLLSKPGTEAHDAQGCLLLLWPSGTGKGTLSVQEYVRARLIQFAGAFARRINPTLNQQVVQQAAAEAIASLPAAELGRVSLESRDLQLVFRHDCLYVHLNLLHAMQTDDVPG